jgi:hypothetical protein
MPMEPPVFNNLRKTNRDPLAHISPRSTNRGELAGNRGTQPDCQHGLTIDGGRFRLEPRPHGSVFNVPRSGGDPTVDAERWARSLLILTLINALKFTNLSTRESNPCC